jgi:uncharacterized protein (TIGR03086 family)
MTTKQPHEIFGPACRAFGETLRLAGPDDWGRATPCDEWDVRDLANHLVTENSWVPALLGGATVEEVGDRFDGDQVGDDPVPAWSRTAQAATDAVGTISDFSQQVHLSYGEEAAAVYLNQLASDFVIHRWDLASGLGQSRTLDPEMLDIVGTWFEGQLQMYLDAGVIAPPLQVAADADPQTRVLAKFGRSSGWPD